MSKSISFVLLFVCTVLMSHGQSYFIVRHAEKDISISENPPLTRDGEARAERLRGILIYREIKSIFSTETLRTKNTALPLALKLQLPIQVYDGANQTRFIDSLKSLQGNTVVVGHTNTLHHVINGLAEKTVFEGPLDEAVYNRIYEIKRRKLGKPEVKVYTF